MRMRFQRHLFACGMEMSHEINVIVPKGIKNYRNVNSWIAPSSLNNLWLASDEFPFINEDKLNFGHNKLYEQILRLNWFFVACSIFIVTYCLVIFFNEYLRLWMAFLTELPWYQVPLCFHTMHCWSLVDSK